MSDPPYNRIMIKRINHFNDWLSHFPNGTNEIPPEIYVNICKEINKNKNIDMKTLNDSHVRETLDKINYNEYYEYIDHIIIFGKLGHEVPRLDKQSEETLRSLFLDIQTPFMDNCPSSRTGFISYSYVTRKLCELQKYDHLLCYFPLLKSTAKLQFNDTIWKKICSDLKWEFIPSVYG